MRTKLPTKVPFIKSYKTSRLSKSTTWLGLLFFTLFLFNTNTAFAQTASQLFTMEVQMDAGDLEFGFITRRNADVDFNYNGVTFNNTHPSQTSSFTHTYTASGTYTIAIRPINSTDGTGELTIFFI